MCVWLIELDLAELRRAPLDLALWQNTEKIVVFDVVLEYQFGAGPQAHRYVGFSDRGKATGGGVVESRRHQLVGYLRRPGFDEMQTEIAHGRCSSAANSPMGAVVLRPHHIAVATL
jgi:hypothetical protein